MEEDKKIAKLLAGIHRFFNSKFPPGNYEISPCINNDGYHMTYLNVRYDINFSYKESVLNPHGHNLIFKLRAELPEIDKSLERRLDESKISNIQLDKMSGLTGQKIEANEESINISCVLKKTPTEENEIDVLCDQLWGYIIKKAFSVIYKA